MGLEKESKVQLVFGSPTNITETTVRSGIGGKAMQQFAVSIDDIRNLFKQFQIESIEVWISGGAETGEITKLFISAKGEGGLKVTLRPKSNQDA